MIMQTKNLKYWKWATILLVVLNIFTIGSFLYHYLTEKSEKQSIVINNGAGNHLNGRFFRYEIGFDDEQLDKFREINQLYNPKASDLVLKIDSLKKELFNELNKNQADTTKLNFLADEIGRNHALLKKNTNAYYLSIKSIATPIQYEKIKVAFLPLFQDENMHMRGNGAGNGRGNGHRRNHMDSVK